MWTIIDKALGDNGATLMQLKSYDNFISKLGPLFDAQAKFETITVQDYQQGGYDPKDGAWEMSISIQQPITADPIYRNFDGSKCILSPMLCRTRDLSYTF